MLRQLSLFRGLAANGEFLLVRLPHEKSPNISGQWPHQQAQRDLENVVDC